MNPFPTRTFYFDDRCGLCRSLAAWGVSFGVSFVPWATAQENFPDVVDVSSELRFWDGQNLVSGTAAWEALIEHDPRMAAFNWIAKRLGLQKSIAVVIERTGGLLAKICRSCGRGPRLF